MQTKNRSAIQARTEKATPAELQTRAARLPQEEVQILITRETVKAHNLFDYFRALRWVRF